MWKFRYAATATRLLFQRKISWRTFRRSIREWPIAVAGIGGSYQLDPDFLDHP